MPDPERFRATAAKLRRNRLLVFSRYCQVMFRFEMELYANPTQDLNRLWWDLVEKYQEIKRPEGRNEPDYASKYHLIGVPVYYHNYMLGEMFASQVHHALVRAVLPGVKPDGAIYVGNKAAGTFMKQRVFQPGLMLNWNDLTRHATGEELNARHSLPLDRQAVGGAAAVLPRAVAGDRGRGRDARARGRGHARGRRPG